MVDPSLRVPSTTLLLPVNSNSSPVVIKRAVSMLASQLSEGSVLGHLLHWQAVRVRHEQSPHLKFPFCDVPAHLNSSKKYPGNKQNSQNLTQAPFVPYLCQKVESSSSVTSWNFSPDQDNLGAEFSASLLFFFKALYSSKFSFLQRCFQK